MADPIPARQQVDPANPRVQLAALHGAGDQMALALLALPPGPVGVLEFACAALERLGGCRVDPMARLPQQVTRPIEAAREALAAARRVMETGLVLACKGDVPSTPEG